MAMRGRKEKGEVSRTKETEIRKVATQIAGMDEVLNGGLPAGQTTLISGGPGTGKSVLGLEFLYRGAAAGEPGIFVTFEERASDVRQNALALGWDLAPLEQAGKLFLMEAHVDPQAVLSGDFNLKGLIAIINGKATTMRADRIVIDALDVLLRLFDDAARERNELYVLHDWLIDHDMTAVLTVKTSKDGNSAGRYEFLDFMANCVICLDQPVTEQIATRHLRVLKYRGSGFGRNEYPFCITGEGINIIPISFAGLQHKALGPKVSSGHPRLDALLDGGYRRGSCTLMSGTTGTGKTSVASTFVRSACERGEKVLYIDFEESQEAMVYGMLSPGIDLRPAVQAGTLRFLTAMPEAMGVEEHLSRAFKAIKAFQPDHVIVDAISSCERMGTRMAAFGYLTRVVNTCKERGITLILINQTAGFREENEISGIGISSMVDTIIFLRYIEIGGEINRMVLVMKSRGAKHSNQYREFLITDHGIEIPEVYVGEGGVLTGAARQEQEAREEAQHRRRFQEIEQKEHEVIQRRAALQAQTATLKAELEAAEAGLQALRLDEKIWQNGRTKRGEMRGGDADSARLSTHRQRPKRRGTRRPGGAR
jgi:circadian clock protein KaiC